MNQETIFANEPSLRWFKEQIKASEHVYRISQVKKVKDHLLGHHKVLGRYRYGFHFKGKEFNPATMILQGLKTTITFHASYTLGVAPTLIGTGNVVELFNRYYRKGHYAATDYQILTDLLEYGDAFEYVYYDFDRIKSKVFRNEDSYPIYDSQNNYIYFVEYWKDKGTNDEHYTIYAPDYVDTYINNRLVDRKLNLTGLPIHYVSMERGEYSQFGYGLPLDLIPIQDEIENTLNKLSDAVTTLSLNPIALTKGQPISENDMIDSNVVGAMVQLETDGDMDYVNAEMDYNSIKLYLDNLIKQYNTVAAIPAGVLGNDNTANISETTTNILYSLTDNKSKQYINCLIDGFVQRWNRMRFLMALFNGDIISDEDFETLDVSFNINKPVDNKNNMEIMKMQYDMGAISRRTIIEKSPFTTDSAEEIKRLAAEGNAINEDASSETDAETNKETEDEEEKALYIFD